MNSSNLPFSMDLYIGCKFSAYYIALNKYRCLHLNCWIQAYIWNVLNNIELIIACFAYTLKEAILQVGNKKIDMLIFSYSLLLAMAQAK